MRLTFTLCLFLLSAFALAQPSLTLVEATTSVVRPVSVTNAGDARLFVVEQRGQVMILDTLGFINATPYLDIRNKVNDSGNEQGLLGLAFPPNFEETLNFYVYYTGGAGTGRTKIARYSVDSVDAPSVDPATEEILIDYNQPFSNHNGGDMNFGPDGYLYISSGDGGFFDDPGNNGQNDNVFLGKILRIDVDTAQSYRIPSDNPYAGQSSKKEEIWSLGLRNPWRFSFDRSTGDMWIADVGQDETEEVNFEPVGSPGGINYGWRCYEGSDQYIFGGCAGGDYTFPIYEYPHDNNIGGISVTGGFAYRGMEFPEVDGTYFFCDYVSGNWWATYVDDETGEHETVQINDAGSFVSGFGEDQNGEIYVCGLSAGAVYKLTATCPEVAFNPTITQVGDSLVCDVAFGEFVWFRNGTIIVDATNSSFTPEANSTDTFTVHVTINDQGCIREGLSNELSLAAVPSGIYDNFTASVKLRPNPALAYVMMDWKPGSGTIQSLYMVDVVGKRYAVPFVHQGSDLRIELSDLSQGYYQVVVNTDQSRYSGRVIVQ